jgi:hypothetical protein
MAMTNEEKVKRLEEMARWDEKQALRWKDIANNCKSHPNESAGSMALSESASSDAALLRECAAMFMRERDKRSLLTGPDWKTMYEAQERDLEALRKELEELREKADFAELDCDQWNLQYGFSALRAARGEK